MAMAKRICLVSPGHVSRNPRLVKEANALAATGYQVHVIAGRYFEPADANDAAILHSVKWSYQQVDFRNSPRTQFLKAARRALRAPGLRNLIRSLPLSAFAQHPMVPLLARAAAQQQCDLYIGHCLAGLAAVAIAGQKNGVPYAFDAEDHHDAETDFAVSDPIESAAIRRVQEKSLPDCRYITASSSLIAGALAKSYGIARPTTILNVFPLAEAPPQPHVRVPSSTRRLYWFSQTIGPGRGLESVLPVLARMTTNCELHLRGIESPGFRHVLTTEAQRVGFDGRIEFHPTAPAAEMSRLAETFDLGLSVEQPPPLNRDLCLTNKIFTYLLAGIPVALTPTAAQRELATELGDAAIVIDLSSPDSSARQLDAFFQDEPRYEHSRSVAWKLARDRFNWDVEQTKFIELVASAFPTT